MGNAVTWFEINTPAPRDAAAFYTAVFGWTTQDVGGGYLVTNTAAGTGINGGFGGTEPGPAGAVFYVQGPDIQALLDRANGLRATTVLPVTEIPDMVTYAQFRDPWGNVVGLLKGGEDEVPEIAPGENPPVDWVELRCSEPERAWDFYRELFGWQIEGQSSPGGAHGMFDTGHGGARGGIGATADGQPHVAVFAAVADLQACLDRAAASGGSTVMAPMQVDPQTTIAMFTDPQGTPFGLYRHAH